jgi:hypothetical protein
MLSRCLRTVPREIHSARATSAFVQPRPTSARTYAVKVTLSLEDAAGGAVSYQLEINEPRTRRGLAFRVGAATTGSVNLTLRAKPPRGARTLQLKLSASDVVGNDATVTKSLRLPQTLRAARA